MIWSARIRELATGNERSTAKMILLDTTELLRVMPRKLHAAWA